MWAIPQQAKLKYTQLFNVHDRNRSGFLSGLQCRDILLQSGLPRNILADIWNLSDIDGDGQLTREEFILAMHLTNHVRSGQPLPDELPADLVPPSYRRTRSISATSVHSAGSSVAGSANNDDQASQKSAELSTTGSVLNSHSFEDKRRENFEKGRAELERRRLKMIEQQTSILNEQSATGKKQVAEAKAKIDKMRSERDTKAGLITSLEAQLHTVRERKAYLDHEESSLIAIAKDLNLVNSADAIEIDAQATKIKQENIRQMKEKLIELQQENVKKAALLAEAKAKLEDSKSELKNVSEELEKTYENYQEKISKAKIMRQQFIEENKSKTIDLDSIWDSAPSFSPQIKDETSQTRQTEQSAFELEATDPWAAPTSNNNIINSKTIANETLPFEGNTTPTNSDFELARDYSALAGLTSRANDSIKSREVNSFGDNDFTNIAPEPSTGKRKYRALYAFEARNPDELTINPGDIIIGSEVVCEPGWLSGETNGKNGLFPEAYVEPLLTGDHDVRTTTPTTRINPKTTSTNSASIPATTINSSPVRPRYSVLYEFEARNLDELTIKPGDIIFGVDGAHEPGWLMGELGGHRGLFPEAYVEKLPEAAQAEQTTEQTTGTLRRGSSSGSLRSKKSRTKKAEVATVIANYRALGQEQLNLEKGQLVLIRRKMDSGWWEGELQIKGPKELNHLVDELISSEWDYLNDLRLCYSAYIVPLSASLGSKNEIFNSWKQLIESHEIPFANIAQCDKLNYRFVFEQFEHLLCSVVGIYTSICSNQNESMRQLETKMVSDIRFRQLVNESQRSLKRMIEQQVDSEDGIRSRAIRNSNLPLDSFLLKPMQRITKYSLLFERMFNVIINNNGHSSLGFEKQVEQVRDLAQFLCQRVNEACRQKEDEVTNEKRLRWCQSHIRQLLAINYHHYLSNAQLVSQHHDQSGSMINNSNCDNGLISNDFVGSSLTPSPSSSGFSSRASFSVASSMNSLGFGAGGSSMSTMDEMIFFESETNYLGPRRLIKAGSLIKLKPSCRELVAFLFNDFLLLTQVKNNSSLRVEDVFKSEQAQQAYYKPYKRPIMLENLIVRQFDGSIGSLMNEDKSSSNGASTTNSLLCSPISIGFQSNINEALIISFVDQTNNSQFYNLMALNGGEKETWLQTLTAASERARKLHGAQLIQRVPSLKRRLSLNECLGRLFVTVLELSRQTAPTTTKAQCHHKLGLAHENIDLSPRDRWTRKSFISGNGIQNVCLTIQLLRYRRPARDALNQQPMLIEPLSDIFKTKTFPWCSLVSSSSGSGPQVDELHASNSQPDIFGTGGGSAASSNSIKFDHDSTQFLIANKLVELDEVDYLHIDLVEDSRFKRSQLIARKRINVDRLVGLEPAPSGANRPLVSQISDSTISNEQESWPIRQQSSRSEQSIESLQPNRPIELVFKLKPSDNFLPMSTPSAAGGGRNSISTALPTAAKHTHKQIKFTVKLRLHLQTFCDTN